MSNVNPITRSAAIAAQLGETDSGARATIWRTVRTLGPERAQACVKDALEADANGSGASRMRAARAPWGGTEVAIHARTACGWTR